MRYLAFALLLCAACTEVDPGAADADPDGDTDEDLGVPEEDLGVAADLLAGEPDGAAAEDAGAAGDAAPVVPQPDGGPFVPPAGGDSPVEHAPPTAIAPVASYLAGLNVLEVSVDQGGGVWAVTPATVYYFPPGKTSPFTYDQKAGLARGQYSWTDTWFDPGTHPVTFSSVAGGLPGQAIVGNFGAIADRLEVDPTTGAVTRVQNLAVTSAQVQGPELAEHLIRVVAVWHSVVDLNGTWSGTAYLGGLHGFYALHGLDAACGCLDFEEHQHYITDTEIGGGDVKALALTADGDVVQGDRDFVTLLPQRSQGPTTGLFDATFAFGLDVFPGVRDEVFGVAVDASDGIWVASDGNGLAYLAPVTHDASYWSAQTALPQNHLRGVAVDGAGDVWVATASAGLARLHPATNTWRYYTQASGLPSNAINALSFDHLTSAGDVWLATSNGVVALKP